MQLVGRSLKDVLPHLRRCAIDVEVEVRFQRRTCRGHWT